VKYGLGVFREGPITNNNLHKERCSQLLTQMNGCSILFSCNLWFRVKDQDEAWTFVVPNQPLEISNLESVNS